jgi:site-specific recombinase XerD
MSKKKDHRAKNGLPWLRRGRMQYYVTNPDSGKKTPLLDRNGLIVRPDAELTDLQNQNRATGIWFDANGLRRAGQMGDENPLRVVFETYLQSHAEKNVEAKTMKNYTRWFKSFLDRWPGLTVRDLNVEHIERWWTERHPEWGTSYRNLVGSAFKAALNWCASTSRGKALIPANPVKGWKLPTMKKRSTTVVISTEEHARLLAIVKSQPVRDILEVLWDTGTRPINLTRATAGHVSANGVSLVFDENNTPPGAIVHKTFKRTGEPLVVLLSSKAQNIIRRLVEKHPSGPLFRSPSGLPWTACLLANTIRNYACKAGLEGRYVAYSGRHSLATHLLTAGQSTSQVAAILGNTASVVERNYSHVQVTRELRELLEARSGSVTEFTSA